MIGRGRDRGGFITTIPSLCPPSMGSLRTTSSTRSGANDASIHVPFPARSRSRRSPSSLPRPLRGHRTASAFSRGGSRCARAQQCFPCRRHSVSVSQINRMGVVLRSYECPRQAAQVKRAACVAARCALLCSTAWGTVSQSYREEILRESPLNALLKRFDNPFAFSNGVPGTAIYTYPLRHGVIAPIPPAA